MLKVSGKEIFQTHPRFNEKKTNTASNFSLQSSGSMSRCMGCSVVVALLFSSSRLVVY
jgi:hypothetical protein